MKKIILLVLVLMMLVACGDSDSGSNNTKDSRKPAYTQQELQEEKIKQSQSYAQSLTKPTATPIPVSWGVSKIIDGDTFDLGWTTGEVYRVRILGIDTPEIYSANTPYEYDGITNIQCLNSWGLKATEFAQNTLLNKSVTVITDPFAGDQDIYDRLLRYVEVDGKDFSAMLLENGYARVYTESKSSRIDSYLILEENAKKNKVGLWGCPTLPVNID
tara:strand:- start:570 stop:1217 length:648 start_codon:yes stop_codon:yes gene_type:complete